MRELQESATVDDLVSFYFESNDFKMLREKTQKDYKYFLSKMQQVVGKKEYKSITSRMAKHMYEDWVTHGVSYANHICSACITLYNYALHMEYVDVNPFSAVKKKTVKQRKVVWTTDQIKQFLDYAYSSWEHRSVGLIVHMAYEWCQRVGDMRLLKWDNIDMSSRRLMLEQSKRGAQVELPIHDDLFSMLEEQHQAFGFQPYVAPQMQPADGEYKPYGLWQLSKKGRLIMDALSLPKDLRLMDLRRTGTTEMVNAGVSMAQIMSVTGHANPQSVKPYMRHTYDAANSALTQRKSCSKSISDADKESDI